MEHATEWVVLICAIFFILGVIGNNAFHKAPKRR